MFTAQQASVGKMFESQDDLASFLTNLVSASAFFELLGNPVFGKLSDSFGRRPIVFIGNISTVICRFLMFLYSKHKWPVILEQLITVPLVTSFFTTWRASASDILRDKICKVHSNCRCFRRFGVACWAHHVKAYHALYRSKVLLFSIFSIFGTCYCPLGKNFEETLPEEKRELPLL